MRLERTSPAQRNDATIGYIGVVLEQRGHGYGHDLLAEKAWRLAELAPGEEVGADTDVGNVPMARAFAREGSATTPHGSS